MTPYKAGDVVAVEFPFSDLRTLKRRPGLVIVGGKLDLLVARITTHAPRDAADVPLKRWSEIKLPLASTVRLTKLATIDSRLVHHKVGRLHPEDADAVTKALQQMAAAFAAEAR